MPETLTRNPELNTEVPYANYGWDTLQPQEPSRDRETLELHGNSISANLDTMPSLMDEVEFHAQTGFNGRAVAEIAIADDPSRVMVVIDGRQTAQKIGNGRAIWEQLDGDRAQTFSSDVVLAEMKKSVDSQGRVSYEPVISYASKGSLATGIKGDNLPFIIGRGDDTDTARRNFTHDDTMSRHHLQINYDKKSGDIRFSDLNSTNGTKISVSNMEQDRTSEITVPKETLRDLGNTATTKEVELGMNREFMIDNINYKLKGVVDLGNRDGGYLFTSVDTEGKERQFFVYRSNSEGGLRVSQGTEPGGRYLKGAENDYDLFQYTQDTQMHPEFEEQLSLLMEAEKNTPSTLEKLSSDTIDMTREQAADAVRDFGEHKTTYAMSLKAHQLLARLKPGESLSDYDLPKSLDLALNATDGEKIRSLTDITEKISRALEQDGVVPDFTNPVNITYDTHPLMGDITKEVYRHNAQGRIHEWTVAHDANGRVWIDRIRLADSKSTPYGTDKEMLFSGALTSKPLEYKQQCSGLPSSLKVEGRGHYDDITPFLDMFGPIKKYRQQSGIQRR